MPVVHAYRMIDGVGCRRHLHIIRGAAAAKSPCIRMRGDVASPCKVGGLIKLVLVERERSELRAIVWRCRCLFWRWEKRDVRVEDVKGKDLGCHLQTLHLILLAIFGC